MPPRKAINEDLTVVDYRPKLMDLAASERPRERLTNRGPQALSNAELIAILIRVGVKGENVVDLSQRLLAHYKNLSGLLRASIAELSGFKGVGEAKATQIKAALELALRLMVESPDERPIVK